ncbi:MAG: hypothetical protein V2J51_08110 [Erythrobacter sp.]|nr:hypothetical protein [Erythrobacter sp.]
MTKTRSKLDLAAIASIVAMIIMIALTTQMSLIDNQWAEPASAVDSVVLVELA